MFTKKLTDKDKSLLATIAEGKEPLVYDTCLNRLERLGYIQRINTPSGFRYIVTKEGMEITTK